MARLTVQFPEQTSQTLADLALRGQISKTEVLRRALVLYKYFELETRDGKRKVMITDENDKILKEVVMTD